MIPVALVVALALPATTADLPTPTPWQPGVISGPIHDAAPAFTPDGRTVYFGRSVGGGRPYPAIYTSRLVAGRWTPPEIAPFSGRYSDMEPAMSPDGAFMIFVSSRPLRTGDPMLNGHYAGQDWPEGGGALWRVDRTPSGWSRPYRLPDTVNVSASTFAPAVACDGTLYFMHPTEPSGRFHIYEARYRDGAYEAPRQMPFTQEAVSDVDPAVAADGSLIVFGSRRDPEIAVGSMDLFIAFKREDGEWGRPVHLGPKVNAAGSDAEARLSPDGRRLYFSSERLAADKPRDEKGWNNGKYNIWTTPLPPAALARLKAVSIATP
ncbi:hypothetical protein [Caulobacter sp. 1776]|uniref:TolB family protein n=1 Tax=Caulobacter sp. 1776 TaxID=3156420 RepID=UPI00339ACEB0